MVGNHISTNRILFRHGEILPFETCQSFLLRGDSAIELAKKIVSNSAKFPNYFTAKGVNPVELAMKADSILKSSDLSNLYLYGDIQQAPIEHFYKPFIITAKIDLSSGNYVNISLDAPAFPVTDPTPFFIVAKLAEAGYKAPKGFYVPGIAYEEELFAEYKIPILENILTWMHELTGEDQKSLLTMSDPISMFSSEKINAFCDKIEDYYSASSHLVEEIKKSNFHDLNDLADFLLDTVIF